MDDKTLIQVDSLILVSKKDCSELYREHPIKRFAIYNKDETKVKFLGNDSICEENEVNVACDYSGNGYELTTRLIDFVNRPCYTFFNLKEHMSLYYLTSTYKLSLETIKEIEGNYINAQKVKIDQIILRGPNKPKEEEEDIKSF